MPNFTQSARLIAIETQLGEDVLLLKSFQMSDAIGRPFVCTCELRSETHDVKMEDVLGGPATIRITQTDGKTRYINGVISRFSQEGTPRAKAINKYSCTIVPALWLLTRTADCRIFQQLSVTDVIVKVLKDFGVADVELAATATYEAREYIVQYRETAFNFVSRLMEEEGLFYFFKHENGKHTMVISDATSVFAEAPGYETVVFHQNERDSAGIEHVWKVTTEQVVQPGVFVLRDFDFKVPTKQLESNTKTIQQKQSVKNFEVYDYPGFYETSAEGDRYVKVRMEESDAMHTLHRFQGDLRGLTVGSKFKLNQYPIEALNIDFVMIAAQLAADVGEYGTDGEAGDADGQSVTVSYTAIPHKVPFRTARTTAKPMIAGPQTAFVTGPSGEEIHVDEHGRVKVQFNWDRDGKGDDTTSCWVRVSQNWAGKKWGCVFLPRVGHEVIVEFLEGDPDRPIITGRVFNGTNTLPYKLPDNKTMSVIKTCTSKGGGGFNEIRFEDKKGEEEIFIHAEKDVHIYIKNDRYAMILNNEHLVVKKDSHTRVEQDVHRIIKRDLKESIERNTHLTVAGDSASKIEKTLSLYVKGDVSETFDANHHEKTKADYFLNAKNIVLEAVENITLKVGKTTLAMTEDGLKIATDGDIAFEAKKSLTAKATTDIKMEASANFSAKGTAGLKLESPAMAELKSANTTVKGDGMTTISGGLVKIN